VSILDIWTLYTVFGVAAFSAAFVWAVRARQFTDLDRARYIALKDQAPAEKDASGRSPGRLDRYTWLALLLIAGGVLLCALWLGLFGRRS